MKTNAVISTICLVSLFIAGCLPRDSDGVAIADTGIAGPEFSANKGLFVPEDTRRSLGLKIVEVGEHSLAGTLDFSLRVFAGAGNRLHASGLVGPEQVKALRMGQRLELRTGDGRKLAATITALDGAIKQATGSTEVLVELPWAAGIPVGSFFVATAAWGEGATGTTVPRSALIQSTEGYFVYAVSGKHFVRTPVKIGALAGDQAEIREGLYSGDQVVSEPVTSLWLTELAAVKGGQSCCAVPGQEK